MTSCFFSGNTSFVALTSVAVGTNLVYEPSVLS